jgi:spore germination protein YaaH
MSVPYFGYEWPAETDQPGARTTGGGVTLSYAPVDPALVPGTRRSALQESEKYGLRRDSSSGSPYYAYEDSVGWRQGWFEDAESLRDKYEYVREAGLRGVAIFPPAYGSDELEAVLREFFAEESL